MNLRKYLSSMRDYEADDILRAIGLQRKTSGDWMFPMLAGLGAGIAIGAGIAVFLTPDKGQEARERFLKSATDAQKLLGERVQMLTDKVQGLSASQGGNVATQGGNVASRGAIGSTGSTGVTGGGSTTGGNRTY